MSCDALSCAIKYFSLCVLCRLSSPDATCRIHTTARELPMKRVAIQVTIASNLPWPVILTALTLAPQHGFRLDPSMGLVNPLCPLTLPPSSTASALLFVSTKSGGRSASRGHMLRGGAGQGRGLPVILSCSQSLLSLFLPVQSMTGTRSHSIAQSLVHASILTLYICSVPSLLDKIGMGWYDHDCNCSQTQLDIRGCRT